MTSKHVEQVRDRGTPQDKLSADMCPSEIDLFELRIVEHEQILVDADPVHVEHARDRGTAEAELSADVSFCENYTIGKFRPAHGQAFVDLSSGRNEDAGNLGVVERNSATRFDPGEIDAVLQQAPVKPKFMRKFGILQIDGFRETRAGDMDAETGQGAAILVLEQDGLEEGRPQDTAVWQSGPASRAEIAAITRLLIEIRRFAGADIEPDELFLLGPVRIGRDGAFAVGRNRLRRIVGVRGHRHSERDQETQSAMAERHSSPSAGYPLANLPFASADPAASVVVIIAHCVPLARVAVGAGKGQSASIW